MKTERIHKIGKQFLVASVLWFIINSAILLYAIGPKAIFTHNVHAIAAKPDIMFIMKICLIAMFIDMFISAICFFITCRADRKEKLYGNQ